MPLATITGASGLLGGNLAAELLAQGWTVRATRRGSTKIAHLSDLAIEWVPGDLDDVAALTAAFTGADVVFHCAAMVSILPKPTKGLIDANLGGTERVLAAMRAAKAKRLVHTSSTTAIGLAKDDAPATEDNAWDERDHAFADGYATTKWQSEQVVRKATDVDAVIVNPGYMLGPRDARPSSGGLIIKVARRQLPGTTAGTNNFVDARDVARGMILAADQGARGERYILGGDQLTYREAFAKMAKAAGVAPPRFELPRWVAGLVGRGGDAWYRVTGKEPTVNSPQVRYAYATRFAHSSAKAERVLGYRHAPIERAIDDAIAWFRAHRML